MLKDLMLEIYNLWVDLIVNLIFKSNNKYDWNTFWQDLGFKNITYYDFKSERYYDIYVFKVSYNVTKTKIQENTEQLQNFLLNKNIIIDQKGNFLYIKVRNEKEMDNLYSYEKYKPNNFKIPLAIKPSGKIIYHNLDNASNSNIYVAGTTRCGKSNLIRLLLTQLTTLSRADVRFSIINTKIVDLIEFKEVKNTEYYTEKDDEVVDILHKNLECMEDRYKLFKQKGVKNIWEYRKQVGKIPLKIIVIEELATFQKNKEFYELLTQLASKGAGAGITLLLATQLPNKDILPNAIKQNINTVIGGKCRDSIRSNIIIEDANLHKIVEQGCFKFFDAENNGAYGKVLYIDNQTVNQICELNTNNKTHTKTNKKVQQS